MRIIEWPRFDREDAQRWDAFVARDPHGHLLQTWAWAQLKCEFGWRATRLAVERDGELVVGAQVLYRPLGPLTLGYVPKGPVLAARDPEAEQLLWDALRRRSRRRRAIALKVEPEWRDDDPSAHRTLLEAGLRPSQATIQPRRTIIVDLRPSEDEILARMKSKWRYNVRLSERKGIQVREGGLADLPAYYDLMRITGERDRFGIHSLAYHRRAYELFTDSGRVRLLMAYYQDEPVAGLIAYAFNGMAWYMYGASSASQRNLMPNHQLQWRAMQWAKSIGCAQYDLWGITDSETDDTDESADLSGVERFKRGFGGEVVRYVGAYDQVYSRPLYYALTRLWARRGGAD